MELETCVTIEDLPDTLMLEIFSFLSQDELLNVQRVSRSWHTLTKDRYLWNFCDFSSRKPEFYNYVISSGLIMTLRSLKIVKSTVPQELIQAALTNPDLQGLCLHQSSLLKEKKSHENRETREKRFNISKVKCNLKFLDLRESNGDFNILVDYIFYEGHTLEALGMNYSVPSYVVKKVACGMPLLQILDCNECSWFNDRFMLHLSKCCPNLKYLSAMRCVHISGKYLSHLIEGCKELRGLNLRRTRLSDSEVAKVNWKNSKIEELDVSHCYALDEEGLKNTIPNLRNLRYLRSAVTDVVMQEMSEVAPNIEVFELRRRYPVETDNICILLSLCCNMTCLDISLTPVEAKYFYEFLPKMPTLQSILFAGHEALGTADIIRALRNNCKEIRSVGINYYHASEDVNLKEALLSMTIRSPKLETVALQGLYVEELVKELQTLVENSTGVKKVKFLFPMTIDFPVMESGLDQALKKYKKMHH